MSATSNILGPLDRTSMRIIFLYVGQGEATLVLMPDGHGGRHRSMLIDCNRSVSLKGIDVVKLLHDVLPRNAASRPVLDVFTNTHPHSDHIGGLAELRREIHIGAVWHSGHTPSSAHEGPYAELRGLIDDVRRRGGEETCLLGSRSATSWGAGEVHVLSPAEYITAEIEDDEHRDARIHDQCAVLRLSYGSPHQKTHVLITGDSDKTAWQRITAYHGRQDDNRVRAHVLSASHHGSYTFFKDFADDPSPYEDHLHAIAPERVIISAPDQKDSKHGHPDDDALARYEKAVGKAFVHHMGSKRSSFHVDVTADGSYALSDDRGELAREFAFDENRDDDGDDAARYDGTAPAVISRVEHSRPMGGP